MEIDFTFWKDGDFFIGYLNEFPDYETQGYSLDELKTNLKSLFEDIKSEEIPYIRQTAS
ncbi:MAG: type II toxin-antitoxin system HicB family antitoxin [Spirochaetia bacterium]|nr:type II toxin-antitoxin system HicB family antitoxin [Spirochaetia bacterium]